MTVKILKRTGIFSGILACCMMSVGCGSLNRTLGSWFGKKPPKKMRKVTRRPRRAKKSKKVTRKSLAEQSKLGEQSGSLWVPRGQGAYLFHQNNRRLIGDMINVEMDGCLLYTSPSPRDRQKTRMPSSA